MARTVINRNFVNKVLDVDSAMFRRPLPSSLDANDCQYPGNYFEAGTQLKNTPAVSAGWSILTVISVGYSTDMQLHQIYSPGTTYYVRRASGSPREWHDWVKLGGVIADILDFTQYASYPQERMVA